MENTVEKPTKKSDQAAVLRESAGLFHLTLKTGKTITLEELTGKQQRYADSAVPQECTPLLIIETRALFSVREIDGKKVKMPINRVEVDALADKFSGRELDEVTTKYGQLFTDAMEEDAAKNS